MAKYQPMFDKNFIIYLTEDMGKYLLTVDQLRHATINHINNLYDTSTIKKETLDITKDYITNGSFSHQFHFINFLKKKLRNYNEIVK